MSNKPGVSVIIPAHNAGRTLGRQLTALAHQEDAPPFEVVISLNRCTDGTEMVARSFHDRLSIHTVVADDRSGAAFARNVGARWSSAPILLNADADDEVWPGWVNAMVKALGPADLVGGLLRPPDDIDLAWHADLRRHHVDALPASRGIVYPVGASMGYHRAVFDATGGFDERLLGGSEEIAFALAAQRAGFRIAAARGAFTTYVPRYDRPSALRQRRNYGRSEAWLRALHTTDQVGTPLRELSVGAGRTILNLCSSLTPDRKRRRSRLLVSAYSWGRVNGFREVLAAGCWPGDADARSRPSCSTHGTTQRTLDATLPIVGGRLVDYPLGWRTQSVQPDTIDLLATVCKEDSDVVILSGSPELALTAISVATQGAVSIVVEDELERSCLERTLSRCSSGRAVRGRSTGGWSVLGSIAELDQLPVEAPGRLVLASSPAPIPPALARAEVTVLLPASPDRRQLPDHEIVAIRRRGVDWTAWIALPSSSAPLLDKLRASAYEVK